MKGVEQCAREGFYGDVSEQLKAAEGCNLYGYLEAPKVDGQCGDCYGSADAGVSATRARRCARSTRRSE